MTVDAAAPDLIPQRATPSLILTEFEKAILYGEGGTGKSFVAGTAPEPQWWLTPGGKNELKTVFSPRFIKTHGRKEIFITSIKEDREKGQMADNPTGYDQCCVAVDNFLEWNYAKGIGVKSIIVDNSTILEELMMNKAIMAEFLMADTKEKSTLAKEREYGIRKPHDSTWGGAQSFMDRWSNWLFELPFNLVFVCHQHEVYKSLGGNSREKVLHSVKPLFVGKQRKLIPNLFDNVWHTEVQGGGRSLTYGIQPEKDEIYMAKTRVGGILDPTYERNPNLAEIFGEFSNYAKELEATEEKEQTA
jgi:hypothetical protein